MASTGSRAEGKVLEILAAPTGLSATLAAIAEAEQTSLAEIPPAHIVRQNVSAEIVERNTGTRYPLVQVYCEKLSNSLKEKFRRFSGKAHMAVEVRVSQDRLEGLERKVQLYADGLMQVLDGSRGDWGNGMYYAGGYEAAFGAVKHGGRNFLQAAKISFEVEVSE
jgi:Uma2 family endonuclease